MDLASALKDEILRPLITIVIPGGTALSPFMVLEYVEYPAVREFASIHATAASLIAVFAMLVAGFVLENLGSILEAFVWDPVIERQTGDQSKDWYAYLRKSWPTGEEPVGHRYLRTIVLRMKFESAFGFALIIAWIGTLWLALHINILMGNAALLFSAVVLGMAAYLIWESGNSAEVLGRVRHVILYGHPCDLILADEEEDAADSFDLFHRVSKWFTLLCGAGTLLFVLLRSERTPKGAGLSTAVLLILLGLSQFQSVRPTHRNGHRRRIAWRFCVASALGAVYLAFRLADRGNYALGWLGLIVSASFSCAMVFHWFRLAEPGELDDHST